MRNLWTIYRYEIKKLTSKKLLWVTSLLCVVGIVITVTAGLFGTYYVDGEPIESHYEGFRKDQAYRKAISGRSIDENLLRETVDAYGHVPTNVFRYTLSEEYEAFARPYSDIFNLIQSWTGMNISSIQNWEADECALYEARKQRLESNWQSVPLTEKEKEFWRDQESQIELPLTCYYHEGYEIAQSSFLTVGVLMLLFVAICLSSIFSDEHTRRTDQLILSSATGKNTAYWAKILSGLTVSVAGSTLMALTTMGLCLSIFGAEGFQTSIQLYFYTYSYPLTMGQACLIAYGMLIITSGLAGVFVMVLSELLHSGIATLAISTGFVILGGMVTIPTQYRIVAQIWDWSPMAYLSTWNVFDSRTLTLFGHCFISWQVVPVIYILLSVVLAVGGKYIYRRYQISGR